MSRGEVDQQWILAIETATEVCSVALATDSENVFTKTITEPFQHASQAAVLVQEILAEAKVDMNLLSAIAVSIGPGSFTGLRVGLSLAKGMCYALQIPLLVIDTLQLLAIGARKEVGISEKKLFCGMIDARRMEVYTALYDYRLRRVVDPHALVLSNDAFGDYREEHKLIFVGNGVSKLDHFPSFAHDIKLPLPCSAEYMIPLALTKLKRQQYSAAENCVPMYLKPPNITKPRKVL